jgi:Ankyrin repeats (3 copies)
VSDASIRVNLMNHQSMHRMGCMQTKLEKQLRRLVLEEDNPTKAESCFESMKRLVDWRDVYGASIGQWIWEHKPSQCLNAWREMDWDEEAPDFRGQTIWSLRLLDRDEVSLGKWSQSEWKNKPEDLRTEKIIESIFAQGEEGFALKAWEIGWRPQSWEDESESVAAHYAAAQDWVQLLELLIQEAPKVEERRNGYGNTPFHDAARCGSMNALRHLARNLVGASKKTLAPQMRTNKKGWSALGLAIWNGNLEGVRELRRLFGNDLDEQSGTWTPWHMGMCADDPRMRQWALKEEPWPKTTTTPIDQYEFESVRLMHPLSVIAMNVHDVQELEQIHQSKKDVLWNEGYTEVLPLRRNQKRARRSGASVAMRHAPLSSVKWWREKGSPWASDPFTTANSSSVERKEKLNYLKENLNANYQWDVSKESGEAPFAARGFGYKSSARYGNPLKDVGMNRTALQSIASHGSVGDVKQVMGGWSEKEWEAAWTHALASNTLKVWSCIHDAAPSAESPRKAIQSWSASQTWKCFGAMSPGKWEVLVRDDCIKHLKPLAWQKDMGNVFEMRESVAAWASAFKKHPIHAQTWWKELVDEKTMEKLNVADFGRSPLWWVADRLFEGGGTGYDSVWRGWISSGEVSAMEHAWTAGWFDENHPQNKKEKRAWCKDGLMTIENKKAAWVSWIAAKESSPEMADWMEAHGLTFEWNEKMQREKMGQHAWRWLLNHPDVWSREGAPIRPLEWLWSHSMEKNTMRYEEGENGRGFAGDVQIAARLMKKSGTSIWTQKSGASLGGAWLQQEEVPPRLKKLMHMSSEEEIKSAWDAEINAWHPWAMQTVAELEGRKGYAVSTLATWNKWVKKIKGKELECHKKTAVLDTLVFIDALLNGSGHRNDREVKNQKKIIALWKVLATALKDEKIKINDTKGWKIPVWWAAALYPIELASPVLEILKESGCDWSQKDNRGQDFVNFLLVHRGEKLQQWGMQMSKEYSLDALVATPYLWDCLKRLGVKFESDIKMSKRMEGCDKWKEWWEREELLSDVPTTPIMKKNRGAL